MLGFHSAALIEEDITEDIHTTAADFILDILAMAMVTLIMVMVHIISNTNDKSTEADSCAHYTITSNWVYQLIKIQLNLFILRSESQMFANQ